MHSVQDRRQVHALEYCILSQRSGTAQYYFCIDIYSNIKDNLVTAMHRKQSLEALQLLTRMLTSCAVDYKPVL